VRRLNVPSTNGKVNDVESSYHEKLDRILNALEELNEKYDEIIEKLNFFAIERSAYGLDREDDD
jgi:hypothetical protein